MILIINQLLKTTPIIPGSNNDLFPGVAQDNLEGRKAIVELKVTPIDGADPGKQTELIIIGLNPMKAIITKHKSSFFSGHTITLFIDHIFEENLESSLSKLLYEGGGLLLIDKGSSNTSDWEKQKKVFQRLVHFMMDDSHKGFKDMGRKSYILDPCPNSGKSVMHLSGKLTFNKDHTPPLTTDRLNMHHVATIECNTGDSVFSDYCNCHLLKYLSFYVDTLHSDKGWPVKNDQFSVQNYKEAQDRPGVHPEDQGTEVILRPYYSIPEVDHSFILIHDLPKSDQKRYKALYHTYHKAIGIGAKHRIQLLGYPQSGLTCVAFEAEALFNQKSFSNINYRDAAQWQLLLQMSPATYRFPFFETFGDATIYYLIKKQDLNDGNFSRVQVVVHSSQ